MAANKGRKKKQAKQSYIPNPQKEGKEDPAFNPAQEFLTWKLAYLDLEGPFGWDNVTKEQFTANILSSIKHYENSRWHEIERESHCHTVPVESISVLAAARYRDLGYDYDTLYQLQCGSHRIFGIRDRAFFFVLWWDPNHAVCPSTIGKFAR